MTEPVAVAELLGAEESIGSRQLQVGHATKDFIAGAVSGMVGIAAGQPLDTLRVRLQQLGCQQKTVAGVWRAMAATEGVRGLFRGMSYPIYTTALQNAVTFQAQGAACRLLTGCTDRTHTVSWQDMCLAGMFAGAVQTCISSPVEMLKIRLQLQQTLPGTQGYLGPWGMLRQIIAHEGIKGLTRGFGVTLARDCPSYGLYFATYHWAVQGFKYLIQGAQTAAETAETAAHALAAAPVAGTLALAEPMQQQQQQQLYDQSMDLVSWQSDSSSKQEPGYVVDLSQQLQEQRQGEQPQQQPGVHDMSETVVQFLAGGIAGALAWASIYPIDVVKSRIQATSALTSPYSSAWGCAVDSWHQEGTAMFIRGLGPTMGRGFIVNAAIFASFEALMKAMAHV